MRTRVAWIAVVTCVSTCVPAGAQSVLSESEVLARLSPDSLRARAIRAAVDVARAEALGPRRWPNPRLTVEREAVAGVSEVLTTVLQPLPVTGRRQLESAAADAAVVAVARRGDEDLRRLRADARLAYAGLAAAQVRERELATARARLGTLADVLARREAAGDAAGFDRLRAEREVLDVEADLASASAERAHAQARLAAFLPPGTPASTLVVAAPVPAASELPALDQLVARALTTRGEILALQQDIEAARLARLAAGRRRIPEPEVMAGTKSSSAAGGDVGSIFGVQAVIPLFDRGRPETAVADARAAEAAARLEVLRAATTTDVAAARIAVAERRQVAERYRAAALQNSAEIERIAQVSYDAGEKVVLELLDAYRFTVSARLRQASLDAAVRLAEIELEFVSGWEMP